MIVPGRDAPAIFEPVEELLDPVSRCIQGAVEGYSARQAAASSTNANENGHDLGTALSAVAPSTADLYSAASGLSLVAGQPELAIAFGAGAAAQKSLDYLSNPTLGGLGVAADYVGGKAVDAIISSLQGLSGQPRQLPGPPIQCPQ
jgi:hypothetical protein